MPVKLNKEEGGPVTGKDELRRVPSEELPAPWAPDP